MTFEAFWSRYPRRVGKKDARKAWDKLQVDEALWALIESALAWQVTQPSWTKDGGAFCPYPATWLRGERWTDEPPRDMRPRLVKSARDWREECAELHEGRCSNIHFHEALKGAD